MGVRREYPPQAYVAAIYSSKVRTNRLVNKGVSLRLRESLLKRRPDIHARLQVIETKARQLIEYSQGGSHLTFTSHGFSHVSAVEENYDWLLSEEDVVDCSPVELLCLLCATFFHDALMIPRYSGDEGAARRDHAKRAQHFLEKNRDIIGLDFHEANTIGEIIRGHAVLSFKEIRDDVALGSSIVNIHKLAACLSMADICHADSSRVPEVVLRHLEMDEESAYHWRRHLQISGIARKGDLLIVSAVFFSHEGEEAIQLYVEEIRRQLKIVKPYFDTSLRPIRAVELQGQRLRSQLDVALRFQANTRAILDILIEGVYQRPDVFVRELIQNSLDACHLRLAKLFKRGEVFRPRIVVSLLRDDDSLRAVRIDDNGIGMDVGDIQDTVLWIGNSISKKSEIKRLLEETTGRNLIANFGIGLLSCFKAASSILISSAKEGRSPVQLRMVSITDEINPAESVDKSIGSTFIVELGEKFSSELDLEESVQYYFRMVHQATIEILHLEYSDVSCDYDRDEIFSISSTESYEIKPVLPGQDSSPLAFQQIKGDDFLAWIWIPKQRSDSLGTEDGTLDILNDGVYVSTDDALDWLPQHLGICFGMVNFSPGAIDLPVSRDKVVSNAKLVKRRGELASKCMAIIDKLIESTHLSSNLADQAALVVALCLKTADEETAARIIRRLDSYRVGYFQRERSIVLAEIREKNPKTVYLEYGHGRWVKELGSMDGKVLYNNPDDLTQLQAALLRQKGYVVLSGKRSDAEGHTILEAELLEAYFSFHGIETIDLVKHKDIVNSMVQFKPFPRSLKRRASKDIKFVEVTGLPNKRAWTVGNAVWINVAHPKMGSIYNLVRREEIISSKTMELVNILFGALACDFDGILDEIGRLILRGDSEKS
jgi:hypothetical protein